MKKTMYFLVFVLLALLLAVPASYGTDFSGKTI